MRIILNIFFSYTSIKQRLCMLYCLIVINALLFCNQVNEMVALVNQRNIIDKVLYGFVDSDKLWDEQRTPIYISIVFSLFVVATNVQWLHHLQKKPIERINVRNLHRTTWISRLCVAGLMLHPPLKGIVMYKYNKELRAILEPAVKQITDVSLYHDETDAPMRYMNSRLKCCSLGLNETFNPFPENDDTLKEWVPTVPLSCCRFESHAGMSCYELAYQRHVFSEIFDQHREILMFKRSCVDAFLDRASLMPGFLYQSGLTAGAVENELVYGPGNVAIALVLQLIAFCLIRRLLTAWVGCIDMGDYWGRSPSHILPACVPPDALKHAAISEEFLATYQKITDEEVEEMREKGWLKVLEEDDEEE